jgi:hypothetical protein
MTVLMPASSMIAAISSALPVPTDSAASGRSRLQTSRSTGA